MLMTNFLQKRKSVRDFKNKKIPADVLAKIKENMKVIDNLDAMAKFYLFENGSIIYKGLDGKAGYNGVMIEAPHYIGLEFNKDSEINILKSGYLLEKLNTEIVNLDLDTCWITVFAVDDNTKKSLFGENGANIDYLIAIGYGKKKKLFDLAVTQERLSVEEIVSKGSLSEPITAEFLENRGLFDLFSSIRYAPSHKNFQPWRFMIKDESVYAYMVKKDGEDIASLIDMGIILFYFEEMAKTIGISHKWNIELEDKGEYLQVGNFKL